MIIRDAVSEDFSRLNEIYGQVDLLHREAHPNRFRKPEIIGRPGEYYESVLENPDGYLLVIENEESIIGFAEAYVRYALNYPILQPREWLLIDGIAVDKTYRNSGAGQALLNELIDRAKAKGIAEVELNVYEFNASAINFYNKNGFESVCKTMSKSI